MRQHNKAEAKTAIIALTTGGKNLAVSLKKEMSSFEVYLPEKMRNNNDNFHYYSSLKDLTAELFNSYDGLIFVMALGIVVRMIAPHLQSKKSDPAVITIDETGNNVISTLSGHLGGANKLTLDIAKRLGANPVITTATDCRNLEAVDLLAKRIGCEIEPFSRLKYANAALVNGEKLNIFTDYEIKIETNEQINIYPLKLREKKGCRNDKNILNNSFKEADFNVVISNKNLDLKAVELQLIPRVIVIGIGCRKNMPEARIAKAIDNLLEELKLHKKSIKKIATIDLKKDEKGILDYAEKNELEIEIVSRTKIKEIETDLNIKKSEFVKKITGVAAAAAPAAIVSSGKGKLIMDKRKFSGITLAVFEEELGNE
ncbi:cobalt-precorrin 5A hydrolase [Halanaerobium sp. Z-7514]|uniref:Cobalt-precorrin 5A hydrolase n=1 Tax=Halanaerobium polyolivorans TaxID=2886943 RepID=A0AAW4X0Y6_9FIRM|nr:cobalt-precorrin 5A hydrolase [Halanaerobium polyolivorans]MCC3145477.1 cobalt-precorrin 5A hydrolase [Halanaerobium polyolivorans]